MRSPRVSDRTARARILDAAIRLFGQRGYASVSVRAIADDADVSPALILHHFESKEGLRAACDQELHEQLVEPKRESLRSGTVSERLQLWLTDGGRFRPLLDYLAMMIVDRTEARARLFDLMVDDTRELLTIGADKGVVRHIDDLDAMALVLTTHGLAPLLLQWQIGRTLGTDGLDSTALRLLTIPNAELYTHGLYTDDSVLMAARATLAGETASFGREARK